MLKRLSTRTALGVGGGVLTLILAVVLLWDLPVSFWVESDGFRRMISRETSKGLKVEGEFKPIRKQGWVVTTDGFTSTGRPGEVVEKLDASNVRGVYNPSGYWHDMWEFSRIDIDSTVLGLRGPVPALRAAPAPKGPKPWFALFLPSRVVPQEIVSRRTRVEWMFMKELAHIDGMEVRVTPVARDWLFAGTGGTMNMAMLPPLRVDELEVMMSKPYLEVRRFNLRGLEEGDPARVKLEVKMGTQPADKSLRASLVMTDLNLRNTLPEALREAILARASGRVQWESQPGGMENSYSTGELSLSGLRVQGLPILRQLSIYQEGEMERDTATLGISTIPTALPVVPNMPAPPLAFKSPTVQSPAQRSGVPNSLSHPNPLNPEEPLLPQSPGTPLPIGPAGRSAHLAPTSTTDLTPPPGINFNIASMSYEWKDGVLHIPDLALSAPGLIDFTGNLKWRPNLEKRAPLPPPSLAPPGADSLSTTSNPPARPKRPAGDLQARAELRNIALEAFLPGLRGKASGTATWEGDPTDSNSNATAKLTLTGAVLERLPFLNQMAKLTGHPEFRTIAFNDSNWTITYRNGTFECKDLRLISPGNFDITAQARGTPNNPEEQSRLDLAIRDLALKRWLPANLQQSLDGRAQATMLWVGHTKDLRGSEATGVLKIAGARLSNIHLLNQMATISGHDDLRGLSFQIADVAYGWNKEGLRIDRLNLRSAGNVWLAGSMSFPEKDNLRAALELKDLPLQRWLPKTLQPMLDGTATGTLQFAGHPRQLKGARATGRLSVRNGRLHNWRILDMAARLLGDSTLRELEFREASVDYTWNEGRFQLSNLSLHAPGKLWIRGDVRMDENARLIGKLRFGIAPRYITWMPKARAALFADNAAGFAWATFDVGGTTKKPEQDLTQRVVKEVTSDFSAMLHLAGKAISWYVGDMFGFPYGRL